MPPLSEHIVLRNRDIENIADFDVYLKHGGYEALRMAVKEKTPAEIMQIVKDSGLRGRGGAGFPTGAKWRTVADFAAAAAPATVVVNGAEGEPGTFKDRAIMRANPHAVIEGALIAALAVGAARAVVALKDSFTTERKRLERAIAEITIAGWCDEVTVTVATGPSEYLFGEETALLEVLDGRPPLPRLAPPFRHGVDDAGPHPEEPAGTTMAQPGPGGSPRRWPTTSRRSPTSRSSSPRVPTGSDGSGPRRHRAPSCAPSAGPPAGTASPRSRSAPRSPT